MKLQDLAFNLPDVAGAPFESGLESAAFKLEHEIEAQSRALFLEVFPAVVRACLLRQLETEHSFDFKKHPRSGDVLWFRLPGAGEGFAESGISLNNVLEPAMQAELAVMGCRADDNGIWRMENSAVFGRYWSAHKPEYREPAMLSRGAAGRRAYA